MENVHRICRKEVVQFYHSKHLTNCTCRKAEVNLHLMTNMYGGNYWSCTILSLKSVIGVAHLHSCPLLINDEG